MGFTVGHIQRQERSPKVRPYGTLRSSCLRQEEDEAAHLLFMRVEMPVLSAFLTLPKTHRHAVSTRAHPRKHPSCCHEAAPKKKEEKGGKNPLLASRRLRSYKPL